MRVILDNIIYSLQNAGGISTYWFELSKRLIKDFPETYFIDKKTSNILKPRLGKLQVAEERDKFLDRFRNVNLKNVKEKFIFHSSYNRITNNTYAIQVVTVHDFVHEKYYGGLRKIIHSYQKKRSILTANVVIAISENTKKDLLSYFPQLDSKKVKVVYNGVSDDYFVIPNSYNKTAKPYLIFVGSREKYKNFLFVVDLIREMKNFDFYIVGNKLTNLESKILDAKIEGRYKTFNKVENEQLNLLYNGAYCLIYPSSYEGFGIPLLEAMKVGCPFVALNSSSIPEVAGDAGVLVDDLKISSFEAAVLSIEDNRDYIINKGFVQVRKFSWDKCYQQTLEIYKELYNS